MWEVHGAPESPDRFMPFSPSQVLDEYDGPKTFTFKGVGGDVYLAFWCDEENGIHRYIIVPFSGMLLARLLKGSISVREALNQPWCWLLDVGPTGELESAWTTSFDLIPDEVLPEHGTMIYPYLEPLLTLRAIGDKIGAGVTPGSVIRDAIDGAEKALKILIEYVTNQVQTIGRPASSLRNLYDLPAAELAFNSFEVSFRKPIMESPGDDDENQRVEKLYDDVRELLEKGLKSSSTGYFNPIEIGATAEESRVILRAIERLSPPNSGHIQSIELRGALVAGAVRAGRPIRLERSNRPAIRSAMKQIADDLIEDVALTGVIEEVDKGRSTFEMRDIDDGRPAQKIAYEELFEDLVFDYCQTSQRVRVIAVRHTSERLFSVVAIVPIDNRAIPAGIP